MYVLKQEPEDFKVEELLDLPTGGGTFHYYLLEKRLLGTEECVREIAQALHIPRKHIGYCGNKDRRAITSQYISIKGKKVASLTRGNWNFQYVSSGNRPLSLGMNRGNRFIITIRDVLEEPAFTSTFINYFGEQRFGTTNVQVGLLLLQQKFSDAAALLAVDGHKGVKESIEEKPTDAIRAIRTVPPKLLKLFIHAVQSQIWNQSVYLLGKSVPGEVPIVGFATELVHDDVGKVIQEVLDTYKLDARDFIVRSIPNISSEGTVRATYAEAKNVKSTYDVDEKTVRVSFELPSGTYATEFIRQNMENTKAPPTSKQS